MEKNFIYRIKKLTMENTIDIKISRLVTDPNSLSGGEHTTGESGCGAVIFFIIMFFLMGGC